MEKKSLKILLLLSCSMPEQSIKALVDGGKASPAPPLGPALGGAGLNIGKVVSEINAKTKEFAGTKVPVEIFYDPSDKTKIRIVVGMPPVTQLLKKELGLQKGAGKHDAFVGDVKMDIVVKIAKTKQASMMSLDLKSGVKEVLGTCLSMGVSVEGKNAKEIQAEVSQGKWDKVIK